MFVRGTPEDKTYDIYLARGRVHREGLRCGDNGKLGLGQRSRGDPREVQREGLRCGINGKLGLGCIDRGKKHDLGRPIGVQWEGLCCGDQREAGTQVYRSGDGRCCERTLDVLPTDGLWNDKSVCLICV